MEKTWSPCCLLLPLQCPISSVQCFSFLKPWPWFIYAFTFMWWLIIFFIRCGKVRPYWLLNSPMGDPVAKCSEQWGRPWISQSLAVQRIFLNKGVGISDILSQPSLFNNQIKGWQHLLSTAQNWAFVQWEAVGVIETSACALRPESLCPC